MLKVLLYMYVSFIVLACHAQPTMPDWSGPSELVIQDPNKNVTDLLINNTENGRLVLSWKLAGNKPDFFSIERSTNGKSFEVVGVMNNLPAQKIYQWSDEAPKAGKSLYRIRYSYEEGEPLYSKTIPVVVAGNISYKFYPNPVDHILIVRSESLIDVHISDANGKIRLSQTNMRGLNTINVSNLEKGIYLIRFSSKLTNIMSQEKLIKK